MPFLGQTRCDEFSERNILLHLFRRTYGESWTKRNLWASDQPICAWDGVQCEGDSLNDHGVKTLNLSNNNLFGRFPTETLLLPSLVDLDLSGNPELQVSFEQFSGQALFVEALSLVNVSVSSLAGISHLPNLKRVAVSAISGMAFIDRICNCLS